MTRTLVTGVHRKHPRGLSSSWILKRNLFVVASEVDDRGGKIRSSITIYNWTRSQATYPTVRSANDEDGLPIHWGALSALAADSDFPYTAYMAYDSFYQQSRLFELDTSHFPAVITDEIALHDETGETVDLDVEGLSVSKRDEGGFWVVSEGAGSVDDPVRPVTSLSDPRSHRRQWSRPGESRGAHGHGQGGCLYRDRQ